jgi:hypothetical protein
MCFGAVLVLLLAACHVDTTVGVDLHRDGSGRVRVHVAFDADAARRVPVSSIKLDDLRAAGWRVSRDATSVTIEKPFARPRDLGPTLRELTGSSGLIGRVSATRTSEFSRTNYAARVDIDLRPLAVDIRSDTDLVNHLRFVGLDSAVLELKLDTPLRDAVGVRLVVALPGGRVRSWSVPAGGHVEARATSSVPIGGRVAWLIASAVLAGLAVVLLLVAWLLPGRRRRRAEEEPAADAPPATEPPAEAPPTPAPAPEVPPTPAPAPEPATADGAGTQPETAEGAATGEASS